MVKFNFTQELSARPLITRFMRRCASIIWTVSFSLTEYPP
jgi:hypothetical protein